MHRSPGVITRVPKRERAPAPSTTASASTPASADARRYAELFPKVYLAFHRRDEHPPLSGASRSVLLHLAQSGPLTVGECAAHFRRAQSVISEMVDQLEGHGLLARVRSPEDRRRTYVWLTDAGRARLLEEQQVLSPALLARAFARLGEATRASLLRATEALVSAASTPGKQKRKEP
jgi:DNA-binding MarR family transcriptional regulator